LEELILSRDVVNVDGCQGKTLRAPTASLSERAEVVDDFVRNFLVKMNMLRTLDCFQTEWYEMQEKGLLNEEDTRIVPDIYTRNQQIDNEVKSLRREVEKLRNAAHAAKQMYVKLKKERDFHRMHHKRVVQEKDKLITDIKRLKQHYSIYEPTLRQLKQQYEAALREKMLSKLERDRAVTHMLSLQTALDQIETHKETTNKPVIIEVDAQASDANNKNVRKQSERGRQERVEDEVKQRMAEQVVETKKDVKDSDFLTTTTAGTIPRVLPSSQLTRPGGLQLSSTIIAHSLPVSNVSFHPRKKVLATVSDDATWKLWAIPSGDLVLSGEGHDDWIADVDFHPGGSQLATVSGDGTVKVWGFSEGRCILTFTDHTHAVWGCSFHSSGNFLATSSMDHTAKIFDMNSLRCRQTLRGHADSVNSVQFMMQSNLLCTCSADKTASLWDARTGLCTQTFYGHLHSCNHALFSPQGDMIASCDSYGIVQLWDIRNIEPKVTINLGPHPANRLSFDPSGQYLAVGSNDSCVYIIEIASSQVQRLLSHTDAVQSVLFDYEGEMLISAGSDDTVRIWS
jgi:WD40 repeat protein